MQRPGQALCSAFALMLMVFSLHAMAAKPSVSRKFNHDATGFQLKGAHATTACESCHIGGVFKGTPKDCSACHALGKRVVATPKPTTHIVTDAPCDSCHFNTYTFLGARYNHGEAKPGQCATCHNGRITTGRPADHNSGLKLTGSCDNCHRSYVWHPAGFNHVGVAPHTCASAGCHVQGSNQFYKPANHQTTPYLDRNVFNCDECHTVYTWTPAPFIHDRPSPAGVCMGCHDGSNAPGKNAGHVATTNDCITCHTTTVSWLGAMGAMPANHIPFNPGVTCATCHPTPTTWITGAALHAQVTPTCKTCHDTNSPAYLGNMTKVTLGNHQGSTAIQDCTACHTPPNYTSWTTALGTMPANHIPVNAGAPCTTCHIASGTVATGATLHAQVSPICKTCHDTSAPAYLGNITKVTLGSHQGSTTSQDCTACHTPPNYTSWTTALGAEPANHIPFNAGVPCAMCHLASGTVATGATLHAQVSPICKSCHDTSAPAYLGNIQRVTLGNHQRSTTSQDCTACHRLNYTSWDN